VREGARRMRCGGRRIDQVECLTLLKGLVKCDLTKLTAAQKSERGSEKSEVW
jgi:hypothetical protein